MGYGYLWWTGTMKSYEVYFALGHGGQYIICVPELKMIVVATSFADTPDWNLADAHEQEVSRIIADHVLTAVM